MGNSLASPIHLCPLPRGRRQQSLRSAQLYQIMWPRARLESGEERGLERGGGAQKEEQGQSCVLLHADSLFSLSTFG